MRTLKPNKNPAPSKHILRVVFLRMKGKTKKQEGGPKHGVLVMAAL